MAGLITQLDKCTISFTCISCGAYSMNPVSKVSVRMEEVRGEDKVESWEEGHGDTPSLAGTRPMRLHTEGYRIRKYWFLSKSNQNLKSDKRWPMKFKNNSNISSVSCLVGRAVAGRGIKSFGSFTDI
jgi:hypothetical protein